MLCNNKKRETQIGNQHVFITNFNNNVVLCGEYHSQLSAVYLSCVKCVGVFMCLHAQYHAHTYRISLIYCFTRRAYV